MRKERKREREESKARGEKERAVMRLEKNEREKKNHEYFFAISDSFPNCFLVCFIVRAGLNSRHGSKAQAES